MNKHSPHKLYWALLWDTVHSAPVFDRPAPIWPRNSVQVCGQYNEWFTENMGQIWFFVIGTG